MLRGCSNLWMYQSKVCFDFVYIGSKLIRLFVAYCFSIFCGLSTFEVWLVNVISSKYKRQFYLNYVYLEFYFCDFALRKTQSEKIIWCGICPLVKNLWFFETFVNFFLIKIEILPIFGKTWDYFTPNFLLQYVLCSMMNRLTSKNRKCVQKIPTQKQKTPNFRNLHASPCEFEAWDPSSKLPTKSYEIWPLLVDKE